MNKRNKPSERKNTGKRVSSKDSSRSNSDRRDSDKGTHNRTKDADSPRPPRKDSDDKPYSGPKRSGEREGGSSYGDKKKSFGGPKRFEKSRDKKDGDKSYSDRKKSVSGPRKFDDKKDGESRYGDRKKSFGGPKRFEKSEGDSRFGDKKKSFGGPKRFEKSEDDSRYGDKKKGFGGPKRFEKSEGDSRFADKKKSFDGPKRFAKSEDKRDGDERKAYSGPKRRDTDKPDSRGDRENRGEKRSFDKPRSDGRGDRKRPEEKKRPRTSKFNEKDQELIGNWRNDRPVDSEIRDERKRKEVQSITEETRLNKFLANSGLCSRRDADEYIENGAVSINGEIVKELGVKVMPGDEVRFKGRLILPEKPVYILMNKPKDCITSSDDPDGRRTVLDIIGESVEERIFPVGRLDRNTTGVLLLTNDGDLAQKLTHPSYGVHKIYKADLDKPMNADDFARLQAGVELEDGFIQPDEVAYVDDTRQVIGLEIHSGKNHIVHRMFNSLGYMVEKLDRVSFAGLSKDGLKRGDIRHLTEKELLTLRKSTGKQKA
ncbi:MAG: pseudouridine synthase [Bacteroidia bacterium]